MSSPYNLWDTRKSLGVIRAVRPEANYFAQFFTEQFLADEEYVDFEKLPIPSRKLAPFAMPLGRGRAVYDERTKAFRVKPAYVMPDDAIDPLKPLTFQPGIDNMLDPSQITPMQRLEMLKAAITAAHVGSIQRRWEWLRAKAITDGQVTLSGLDYPTTLVDFGRDPSHTIVLGAGSKFSDAGVSKMDFIQARVDQINDAEFGGMTTKIVMGGAVATSLRKDEAILKHMDTNIAGGAARVDRGIVGGENGARTFKFGELFVGGSSGQTIELWVNNETYENDAGVQERFVGQNDMVFTAAPEAIKGIECFGRIVDRDAKYQAIPIFPKNYTTGDAVKTEHIRHTSAPIMVPVNPDATLKATVL